MTWFSFITIAVIWLIAKMVTDGHKVILLKPTGGVFKFGARIDVTFIAHVTGFFFLCFIHPVIAVLFAVAQEVIDGFMSEQGFDLIDLVADAWGIIWWHTAGMESVIQVILKNNDWP